VYQQQHESCASRGGAGDPPRVWTLSACAPPPPSPSNSATNGDEVRTRRVARGRRRHSRASALQESRAAWRAAQRGVGEWRDARGSVPARGSGAARCQRAERPARRRKLRLRAMPWRSPACEKGAQVACFLGSRWMATLWYR
jgi:hypothetical protein